MSDRDFQPAGALLIVESKVLLRSVAAGQLRTWVGQVGSTSRVKHASLVKPAALTRALRDHHLQPRLGGSDYAGQDLLHELRENLHVLQVRPPNACATTSCTTATSPRLDPMEELRHEQMPPYPT